MKILIPIDFSRFSKIALKYAVKMALKLKAELILSTSKAGQVLIKMQIF